MTFSTRLITTAAAALFLTTAVPVEAQSTWFATTLAGDRVTGDPGDGDGWGVAAVGIDGGSTRYYIWVTDIASPTAAHIHDGVAGSNGGVAIDLSANFTEVASGTYVATGEVTGGSAAALLANPGAFYVNVHNSDHPAGAIRGQVLGDGAAQRSMAGTLRGYRQVGSPGDPDGDGFGVATFADGMGHFYFSAGNVASPTAAHIHMGTALETGGVVVDSEAAFSGETSVTTVAVDQDTAAMILASPGDFYFNIHNTDFPSGAIRGQLRPTETVAFFPVISRAVGQAGSKWTTGLRLIGLADETATAFADWFPSSGSAASGPAATETITLHPGELAVIDDAVSALFSANGNGAVRIASSEPFRSAARIFNDQRDNPEIGGTFGQAAPSYSKDDVLSSGVLLLGSNRPAADGEGFRTNVGYFNPWPETVVAEIDVRDTAGGILGSNNLSIPPFSNRIRNVFDLVPSVPQADRRQDDMLVTFSATRPILMYLSAVDNVTSDAIFVTAEPAPVMGNTTTNTPPNGTIVSPATDVSIEEGGTVSFEGDATDPDGDEMTYLWDFGDGMSSTSLSPGDHTYSDSGSYTVTFTVTDARGAVDPTPDTRTITVESGGGELATFSEVQTRIFNASCAFSGCHAGSSPAQGLDLTAGAAYTNIVDVASSQQPSLDRIEPDEPDASYLYLKIIDDSSISGSRMPRGAPALAQELIDLLRDWIERGAPND